MDIKKDMFIERVLSIIELPYIKSLDSMGIDDENTQKLILSKLFNDDIVMYDGDEINIYNSNGNKIYYEDSEGYWVKYEYDTNGNQIYFENSNGEWYKYEYDSRGNKVYYEDSEGYWVKYEYDSNGNEIYYEDSDGEWSKAEYDSNGNKISFVNSDGYWEKYEYDSNGNLIYYENSHGHWAKREYDSNGKEIYYENSNGVIIDNRNNINESEDKRDMFVERVLSILDTPYIKSLNSMGIDDRDTQKLILSRLFNDDVTINYRDDEDDLNIYNSKRNKVYYEDYEGYWVKYEYDPNGNLIYNENSEGDWFKKEYDSNGNQTYFEDNYGEWAKWVYDSNGKEIYYENSDGDIVDRRNNINESEDKKDVFVNRVLSILELPYFRSLDNIGIDDENTQKLILSKLFSDDITIEYHDYDVRILDSSKNELYYEYPDGFWEKREHDSDGNLIYYEDSDGEWSKYEYDSNGNKIYYEDSNGKIIDRRNNINESEDKKDVFVNKVLSILDTPYIKSLNNMGIDVLDTQELILSRLFNDNVTIVYDGYYYDVHVYNSNGDKVYYEDSNGEWFKRGYDSNRNRIYYENSNGEWSKAEYDSNGNEIYYEDSNGYWIKREYNTYGKQIYYEDSNGKIIDKREYK